MVWSPSTGARTQDNTVPPDLTDADFRIYGDDYFGRAMATVDADGDQRADLVVGAPGHDDSHGRVYLFLGVDLVK